MKPVFASTLADRLRAAAALVGGMDELCRRARIKRRTMGNYLAARGEPKASTLEQISAATGASIDWIVTGRGAMLAAERETKGLLNAEIFKDAVVTTEEVLRSRGLIVGAEEKWRLFLEMYEVGEKAGQGGLKPDELEIVIRLAAREK